MSQISINTSACQQEPKISSTCSTLKRTIYILNAIVCLRTPLTSYSGDSWVNVAKGVALLA